jgi:carbonic anhydrase
MKEADAPEGRQAAADKRIPAHEAEARPAHDAEGAPESGNGGDAGEPMSPVDRAAQANVSEAVAELREADPAISARVASGKLRIVGAFYDETNGKITLQDDAPVEPRGEELADTPQE